MRRPADRADWQNTIDRVIDNLIHIRDTDGSFLLRLDDGRVIDTNPKERQPCGQAHQCTGKNLHH